MLTAAGIKITQLFGLQFSSFYYPVSLVRSQMQLFGVFFAERLHRCWSCAGADICETVSISEF